jgi:hypothetical protein
MSSSLLNKDKTLLKNNSDIAIIIKPFEVKEASVKSRFNMPFLINNSRRHIDINDKNESIMQLKKKFGLRKEKLPKINGTTQYFKDTDFYYK